MTTLINLRSRIEKLPSSLPEAIIQLASLLRTTKIRKQIRNTEKQIKDRSMMKVKKEHFCMYRFHEITLTSASCALKEAAGDLPSLVSHIDIVPSTEQEANTSASVGLHYKDRSNGIHNSITFSISYIFQKIKCQGILVNLQH